MATRLKRRKIGI